MEKCRIVKQILMIGICFFVNFTLSAAVPVITSFSPESGSAGSTVTITGANFNSVAANNKVFFGGSMAVVTQASATSLKVTVPGGAMYAPLSVSDISTGLTAYSSKPFTLTFDEAGYFGTTPNSLNLATGATPRDVVVGDIDGDGKLDLVVSNYSLNTISVFRNTGTTGTSSFAAPQTFALGDLFPTVPWKIAMGDIDGDGRLDLAVANTVSGTVSVFRNTSAVGAITFDPKLDISLDNSIYAINISDLNADGKSDLVILGTLTKVSVLRNIGSVGTILFDSVVDYDIASGGYDLAVNDLDGDGKPDLAVLCRTANSISVLRNTSIDNAGISFDSKVDYATGSNPYAISVGDLDGDGKPDLVAANYTSKTISVFQNISTFGSIGLSTKVDYNLDYSPYDLTIADLNGDGKPDLAASYASAFTTVLINTSTPGSISLAKKVKYVIPGSNSYSITAGDLNNDGKPDLALVGYGTNTLYILPNTKYNVSTNVAIAAISPVQGTVGTTVTITGSGFNSTATNNAVFFGATMATVTAASPTSLTVTVPLGASYAPVSVTDISKGLTAYSSVPFMPVTSGGGSMAANVDFAAGNIPYSVAIGDVDGDGKPDMAVTNYSSNTVSVFRNTGSSGSPAFAAKVDLTTGSNPTGVKIGDIDGDGKPDLAVTNYYPNTVSVFRNTGSAGVISFAVKLDLTTGSSPYGVVIGDIDGDGKPDLAVANSSSVSVLRNTGSAGVISFAAKLDFSVGSGTYDIVLGDFDGDGLPDLATANYGDNTVSVLRNTGLVGAIGFAAAVNFNVGSNPKGLVTGDLNGDGKPDLAIANYGSGTVSVLLNTGSAGVLSFAAKQDLVAGTNSWGIAIGDIDGDGKPDLAVTNATTSLNSVSYFRNTSSNGVVSFDPKVEYFIGSYSISLALGDLDGDGKADIAAANYSAGSVSVLRNIASIPLAFTPASGPVGATVTITGTGFNSTASNNVVFFGATMATVTAVSATNLTVTVPVGATYAPISITDITTGLTRYLPTAFTPTFTGGGGLGEKLDLTAGSMPYGVSIGDLDGDGKPDLAVANSSANTVSVFRNTGSSGSPSFATKIDLTTGTTPYGLKIGDIDGDGKPDIAVVNYGANTVSVFRNTGSSGVISFASKQDFSSGTNPYDLAIGDLDGDGKPDLAIAYLNVNYISLLRNTGSIGVLSFSSKTYSTGSSPRSVVISDVDGDAKPDVIVVNNGSNTVSVFRNVSPVNNILLSNKMDFATGSSPNTVVAGDVDGDGKVDLATANGDGSVSVLLNSGSSGRVAFAAKTDANIGTALTCLAIGDVNGDGKADLVAGSGSSNTLIYLRNTCGIGAVSFAPKAEYYTGYSSWGVAIGDVDGDGLADVVGSNFSSSTLSVFRNIVSVAPMTFSPAQGSVGTTVTITGSGFNSTASNNVVFFGATMATVTAASLTSLTVTVPVGATYAPISVTDITTGLTRYLSMPFRPTFSGGGDWATKSDVSTGTNPFSIATGDLDGDGKPDVAIANSGSSKVSVFRNTGSIGNPAFAASVDITTGSSPHVVKIGDVDGDGKPDLVVTNSSNSVSVFRNISSSGALTFATKVDLTSGSFIWGLSIGDIDGDGKSDLVTVSNNNPGTVSVLRNTGSIGTISFAAKADYTVGAYPQSVAVGDLNGDGKPELAVTNNSAGTVSVLRNTSTAGVLGFATKQDYATGTSPQGIIIGDLDGDGKPDLATANGAGTVSILRNTSSGIGTVSFAAKVDLTAGTNAMGIAIGNLDGDAKADLAVTNYGSNTVSYFRNMSSSGTLTFASKADYATGTSSQGVSIVDLDGDGWPDLVTTNYGAASMSVLRNIVPSSPAISSFTPVSGSTGTVVTLTGTNLTSASAVSFGGTPATSVSVVSPTQLTAVVGAGATGAVVVTTASGTASQPGFTWVTAPSGLTYTTPNVFKKDAMITALTPTVGGDPVTSYTVSPALPAGLSLDASTGIISGTPTAITAAANYTVTATNPGGSTSKTISLEIAYAPTISYISPNVYTNGMAISALAPSSTGGTVLSYTISPSLPAGLSFDGTTGIISGVPTVTMTNTTYTVTATNGAGSTTATLNIQVNNSNLPPAISSVSPLSGAVGTTVTIVGANFNGTASNNVVFFGATMATVTAATPTSLTVTVPSGATYAPVSVSDITSGLTAYSPKPFVPTSSGGGAFDVNVDYAAGVTSRSVKFDDLDGDGKADMVFTNGTAAGSSYVSVARNTSSSGTVSFDAKVNYATGTQPRAIAIGDLDGDGRKDLVIPNYDSRSISVFRNTSGVGSISFAPRVDYTTGINPGYYEGCLSISDLDGDGKPDLVCLQGDSTVSVFRNMSSIGSISFAARSVFVLAKPLKGLSVGDLDGDGKPDLAITATSNNESRLFLLRNNSSSGSISFAPKVEFIPRFIPGYYINMADMDGDGKLDLVVLNSGSNLSVLRNLSNVGSFAFEDKTKLDMMSNSNFASIADFDGDGKPDIAVSVYSSSTNKAVSLFRNISSVGQIAFTPKVDYNVGVSPWAIAAADLDGDGKTDLAVSNSGTGSVYNISLYRNITAPVPVISSFTPATGGPGTVVTITGTNIKTATSVTFGGTAATSFKSVGETTISAVVGAGASGTVSVTTPGGTASLDAFSMVKAPSELAYNTVNLFSKDAAIAALTPTVSGDPVVSYSVSPVLPAGLTLNAATGVISGTPTEITAPATYVLKASNLGGVCSKAISIAITGVPPSNLSYAVSDISFTKGTVIADLTPTVTGTVTGYTISPALPDGLSIDALTGVISGTPTSVAALATYTITASNNGGNITFDLSITVNDAAPSGLSYPTQNIFTKGGAITAITPTVGGGAVVSYSVSPALPDGLSLNASTGEISGTPTSVAALATYTITATNTGGSTSKAISITVNDVAPGSLSYTTPNIFTKGTAITSLSPTVSGGTVMSYTVSPVLPDGLSLNASTGEISGTPTSVAALATYTITATNTSGSAIFDLGITVNDAAPSGLSYPTQNIFMKGGAITAITPTVGGGAVVSYSVSPALPDGLSLNASTGEISGTPTSVAALATYTITASNSSGSTKVDITITVYDKIVIPVFAGDINGNGKIDPGEILGDVNNNGKIDTGEIAGDANGNGKIDGVEVDATAITTNPLTTPDNPVVGCENTNLNLPYSLLSGTPTQYRLIFDAAALAAGLKNLDYTDLPISSTGAIEFIIPEGLADGTYRGTLQLRNSVQESEPYPFEFTINVSPKYIVKKFDDVMLVDNSGGRFVGYQWFKNGVLIQGATDQFYSDPKGLVGSYSVELTTIEGKKINTCDKAFNSPVSKSVKAYPNPIKIHQDITVRMSGFDSKELDDARLTMVNLNGNVVYNSDKVDTTNIINIELSPGFYIGHITTANKSDYAFKIEVTK